MSENNWETGSRLPPVKEVAKDVPAEAVAAPVREGKAAGKALAKAKAEKERAEKEAKKAKKYGATSAGEGVTAPTAPSPPKKAGTEGKAKAVTTRSPGAGNGSASASNAMEEDPVKIFIPTRADDAMVDGIEARNLFPESFVTPKEDVHSVNHCHASFKVLAEILNNHLQSTNDLETKFNAIQNQLKRCLAKRIKSRRKSLSNDTRRKEEDAVHTARIQQLYELYTLFEMAHTNGTFQQIRDIIFKKTKSDIGDYGLFQVTFLRPRPPPRNFFKAAAVTTANSGSAGAGNGSGSRVRNAWNSPPKGGKRKTRKARKSSRKQTRRK